MAYIEKNNKYSTTSNLLSKSKKKVILTAIWSSKKLKSLNNLVIAEEAYMTVLQNFWLVENRKSNIATKTCLKKVTDAKKKDKKKDNQAKKKAKSKDQRLEIRRLVMTNHS